MHPSYLRQFHASQIFHALRVHPDVSQGELCTLTGCDKSTVSVIVKRFEELGLVERRQDETRGRRGRPVERLRISRNAGLLIGVHLEFDCLRFVAASIDGEPIGTADVPLPQQPDGLGVVVREGIGRVCRAVGRKRSEVQSVGVCVPGLIGTNGRLVHSPNLRWNNVAIFDLLRQEIGAPVHVDNDTNGATLAEHMFGACQGIDDFFLIEGGLGLGGGLFLDGRLYRGKTGFAGEIGHVTVVKDGALCTCGALGCLSAYLTVDALAQRAKFAHPLATSIEALDAIAAAGDAAILRLLREAGSLLGLAMANVVNLVNPPIIVVAGTLAQLWRHVGTAARESLDANALSAPLDSVELVVSTLGLGTVPRGGVAVALEGFSSLDRPEAMPW